MHYGEFEIENCSTKICNNTYISQRPGCASLGTNSEKSVHDSSVAKILNSVSDEMTVFTHYKNPIINCYGNTVLWYILIKSVSH